MANKQLINPSDKNVSHTYAGKDRNVVLTNALKMPIHRLKSLKLATLVDLSDHSCRGSP